MASLKCISFGELIIDDNREFFLLCSQCYTKYTSQGAFITHLSQKCTSKSKSVLNCQAKIVYPKAARRLYQATQSSTKHLIYDAKDVSVILPKAKAKAKITEKDYTKLVQEITPFVQIKENTKKLDEPKVTPSTTAKQKQALQVGRAPQRRLVDAPANKKTVILNLFAPTQQPIVTVLTENNENADADAAKKLRTEQIISKLQTRGLQVKRTTALGSTATATGSQHANGDNNDVATLQLLKKLQSKGIRVSKAPDLSSNQTAKKPKILNNCAIDTHTYAFK